MVFLKLWSGESLVSHWERRLIICNRGSITGPLSRVGRVERPDIPRTLGLASGGRWFSYDSGDEVRDVSRKWTPLDLTSEEIGGRGTFVCPGGGRIAWRVVVVVVEANEKGNRKYALPNAMVICVSSHCRPRDTGTGLDRLNMCPSVVKHSRVVVVWRWQPLPCSQRTSSLVVILGVHVRAQNKKERVDSRSERRCG